jgi:hypothetical protein
MSEYALYSLGLLILFMGGFTYLFQHFTTIYEKQFDLTDKLISHFQENDEDTPSPSLEKVRTDEYDWSTMELGFADPSEEE